MSCEAVGRNRACAVWEKKLEREREKVECRMRNRESHVSLEAWYYSTTAFMRRSCVWRTFLCIGEGRTAGLHRLSLRKRHFLVIGFFFFFLYF